jgi:hypothetical protein
VNPAKHRSVDDIASRPAGWLVLSKRFPEKFNWLSAKYILDQRTMPLWQRPDAPAGLGLRGADSYAPSAPPYCERS